MLLRIIVSLAAKIISLRSLCNSTKLQKTLKRVGTSIVFLSMPKFGILLKICLGLLISVVTFAIELPTIASFSAYNIYCIPEIPF